MNGLYINNVLKVATPKPNSNYNMYKHKYWPMGIVKSSDKYFTIVSIKYKSNLLRIYNHTQNKQIP